MGQAHRLKALACKCFFPPLPWIVQHGFALRCFEGFFFRLIIDLIGGELPRKTKLMFFVLSFFKNFVTRTRCRFETVPIQNGDFTSAIAN